MTEYKQFCFFTITTDYDLLKADGAFDIVIEQFWKSYFFDAVPTRVTIPHAPFHCSFTPILFYPVVRR